MTNKSTTALDKQGISENRKNAINYAIKHVSSDQRVIVVDGLNPEDNAMIQAVLSRDPKSIVPHLEKLQKEGSGKIMGLFYVGYGHGSIGQCGFTTIFLENVSMLVAKAFQDSSLYNGQESSTRYLNMSLQECKNPEGTSKGAMRQKKSMDFYEKVLAEILPSLKDRFPAEEGLDEKKLSVYNKSLKAKAFDIARGFLPAGVTTYVSWTTSLQHLKNRIDVLKHHPVSEVREIAEQVLAAAKETYPDSFSHKDYPAQEEYNKFVSTKNTYWDLPFQEFCVTKNTLSVSDLKRYSEELTNRPKHSELTSLINECGQIRVTFPLDFGSFRDMQRHRPWVLKMPLLHTRFGFFPWYLDQLPENLRKEAKKHLEELEKDLLEINVSSEELQNYIPMGYTVQTETTGGLPQYVYVCELRTQQTVHPTFRVPEQKMAAYLKKWFSENMNGMEIALYADMDPDVFSNKRGTQDIVSK